MPVATVQLASGQTVKLGRIRPKARPMALSLAAYVNLRRLAPKLPDKVDYHTKAAESMKRVYLNDRYGDCVIAGKYHSVGAWSAADTDKCIVGTDDEVLSAYHTICGPGDNGCIITDVLDYFQSKGLKFNGAVHKIDGYVRVDWTDKDLVRAALYLFGTLSLGINLPNDWTCTNCVWDTTSSRIVGGHDVTAVGYDDKGVQIATWGGIVTITWAAFTSTRWLEECWCPLSPDWYNDDQLSPLGVSVKQLKDDLEKLKGGDMPPLPDDPTPPPPPPPGPTPNPFWDIIKWILAHYGPDLFAVVIAVLKWLLGAAEKYQAALRIRSPRRPSGLESGSEDRPTSDPHSA